MSTETEENNGNYDATTDIETPKLIPKDLVVLNIPYDLTTDALKEVFQEFGNVEHCEIKLDRENKSRGFGFIRFDDINAQRSCLSSANITANNRRLRVKRPHSDFDEAIENCKNRLFVAKISQNLNDDDLKTYFNHFGEVKEMFRPQNGKGYAFVSFDDSESLYLIFDIGEEHHIKGNRVVVACAEPKSRPGRNGPTSSSSMGGYDRGGRHGSRGGGRGGGARRSDNSSYGDQSGGYYGGRNDAYQYQQGYVDPYGYASYGAYDQYGYASGPVPQPYVQGVVPTAPKHEVYRSRSPVARQPANATADYTAHEDGSYDQYGQPYGDGGGGGGGYY